MEHAEPNGRQPDLTLHAIGQGITSLRSGAISTTFHVDHGDTDKVADLHRIQGKPVVIEIFVQSD